MVTIGKNKGNHNAVTFLVCSYTNYFRGADMFMLTKNRFDFRQFDTASILNEAMLLAPQPARATVLQRLRSKPGLYGLRARVSCLAYWERALYVQLTFCMEGNGLC